MQDDFNSMVHEMLGYSPSDEIPETEFARLTSIYAYSPFIQFLYSQKLREKDPHRYAASVAKTALYFSNPHWLNHQLRDEKPAEFKTRNYHHHTDSVVVETGEVEIDEIIDADEHSEINIANETFDQHQTHHVDDEIQENTTLLPEQEQEQSEETINDLYSTGELTINEELNLEATTEETLTAQTYQEEFLPDDVADIIPVQEDYDQPEIILEATGSLLDEENKAFSDDLASIEVPEQTGETNGIPQTGIDSSEVSSEPAVASPEDANGDAVSAEQELPVEVVTYIDQAELPDATASATGTVAAPAEKEIPPKSSGTGELAFEPLYTIDYFASQGIKLNAEEDGKDKLTTRLKSFTDWLKSMKKIHPEKLSREIDEATELNIKTDAEHSNDQSEILTETMAEVFLKQGLNEKALEVYEKLSLLNPSKSDYFAAKISALKAIGI